MKLQDIAEADRPQMLDEYRAGIERLQTLLDELAAREEARDLDGMRDLVAQLGDHSRSACTCWRCSTTTWCAANAWCGRC